MSQVSDKRLECVTETYFIRRTRKDTHCIHSDDDHYGMIVEEASNDSGSEAESFFDYVSQEDKEAKMSTVIEQSKKVKNWVEYMDSDDDDYGVIVEDVSGDDDDGDDDDEPKMVRGQEALGFVWRHHGTKSR